MSNITAQKLMFFDDWPYEYSHGFEKKQGKPIKYDKNPVLKPELPHEFERTSLYGTILYDRESDAYKMWYPTFSYGDGPLVANLCYATSKDGYVWEKPELDIVKGTNIVLDSTHQVRGQSIIYDEKEINPDRRYKFLVRPGTIAAICSYVSGDGIHWKMLSDKAINGNSDSHIGLMRHPETGKYMATLRKIKGDRRVWLSTSDDFENWTDPVIVKEPPINQSMQTQIYGMQISYYGAYILGAVSYYNTFEDDLLGWGKMDGIMDIGFAHSRSGYCWHENFIEERFIPVGEKGSWDCGMISPSSNPIYLENEIRYYYAGMPYQHKGPIKKGELQCIGVASIRPDGFVYVKANDKQAELMTRNFAVEEAGFIMNANAIGGEILVELCAGDGSAIPGYEFSNFIPIIEDGLKIPLQWKNNPDTKQLIDVELRFKIKAKNAKIYSVTMLNGQDDTSYWKFREIDYADPLYAKSHKDV